MKNRIQNLFSIIIILIICYISYMCGQVVQVNRSIEDIKAQRKVLELDKKHNHSLVDFMLGDIETRERNIKSCI